MLGLKDVLKLPCYTDVFITHWYVHDHLLVVSGCTRKLHICHQQWKKNISVAFKSSKTSFPCPIYPTLQSITILYVWDNIDDKYNAVARLYLSSHPYVFSQSNFFVVNTFLFYNSSIILLLCAAVFEEFFSIIQRKRIKHCLEWNCCRCQWWTWLILCNEIL